MWVVKLLPNSIYMFFRGSHREWYLWMGSFDTFWFLTDLSHTRAQASRILIVKSYIRIMNRVAFEIFLVVFHACIGVCDTSVGEIACSGFGTTKKCQIFGEKGDFCDRKPHYRVRQLILSADNGTILDISCVTKQFPSLQVSTTSR
jgi:hypothetical protein